MMAGWLAVVSAEHVARGVRQGIAQTNHGKRTGLARMHPGDWLVYYSPHRRMGEHSPVRTFTAVGEIADGPIWQVAEGSFQPWRRAVRYRLDARQVLIDDLRGQLDLTAAPNWGYQLRRGLIPLTERDVTTVIAAMTGSAPAAVANATAVATLW
jgi:hypothetical protein